MIELAAAVSIGSSLGCKSDLDVVIIKKAGCKSYLAESVGSSLSCRWDLAESILW
jgi:hypothetical protein